MNRLKLRFFAAWIALPMMITLLLLMVPVAAEDPPAAKPVERSGPATQRAAADWPLAARDAFACRLTDQPIQVDGLADEAAWQAAEVIDQFYLPWLKGQPRPANSETAARLLWDREYLYFFADMDDADLFADITQHDGKTWHNDVFELFFQPDGEQPAYYEFQVNAAATVMDMFLPRRGAGGYERFKSDGRFHIEVKVVRRGSLNQPADQDSGWSVEGRIPWRDFRRTGGRPEVDERWKFALCRYDYSVEIEQPELSTCAPLEQADFHRHEDYATLRFTGPGDVPAQEQSAAGVPVTDVGVPVTDAAGNAGDPQNLALDELKQSLRAVPSRVVGSPDPPPAYRAERMLAKLQPSWPIFVIRQPGSRRLLLIDQKSSYGPARLCRTSDTPESGELETLLEIPAGGVAYSIAFHPRFEHNGYIYIGWNAALEGKTKRCFITRYTLSRSPPYALDDDSALTIIDWPSGGHNGAAIAFGNDGMLYITSGDGTSDSDTDETGQGLDHLLAKVLRIDVDHPEPGRPYSVPQDNPFVGVAGARPETWAYGFRNPWRLAVDSKTGDVWVGNNGQDLWEQVYLVQRGANYGWSVFEGSAPFYPNRQLGPTPVSKPTLEHPHSEARSLTGGIVYYGDRLPELNGAYIYGDYSTGKIWAAKVQAGRVRWHQELADTTLQITGFGVDADGRLLITDHRAAPDGGLYTLVPNTDDDSQSAAFPRSLSASGLFDSVGEHRMHPGVIPYSVNSPLWSDGAHKQRFIALPAAEPTIQVRKARGWDFPDQTVLVKSFALEMDENDPASRRWIETRLFTKQQGQWAGYSYIWNDQQTDATLVEDEGLDRSYTIRRRDGSADALTWRFPSRTECMVCHSRAANFVLGLTTLQLNKDHDYGSGSANQLGVLEQLGVLRGDDAAKTKRLVDPYDSAQDLTHRARSYLHANCSHCHINAGGGNAQIDLEFGTPLQQMKVLDEIPLHHTFGLAGARLIAPGDPERSVLLHRVAHRGQGSGQMPQLATSRVDERATAMLRAWIQQLPQPAGDAPE